MTEPKPAVSGPEVHAVLDPFTGVEGALLPMLHALQEAYGHVPEAAHAALTARLGITRAELSGVLSFYHDFRAAPAGRRVLKICRAEACQAVGGEALAEQLLAGLGLEWHGTTPDGALTVEPVYCLGLCACGPAVLVDGQPRGRVEAAPLLVELRRTGA